MGKKYYNWIDVCKTFGLLLVVLGHGRLLNEDCQQWIYSFHMPLFFILSGMLYNYKTPLHTIKHDIKRLLIPYFIINSICLIIQVGIMSIQGNCGIIQIFNRIIGILVVACNTGDYPPVSSPTWFIITLFFVRVLLSLNNSKSYLILLIFTSLLCFVLLKEFEIDTWLPIDSAFMATPFVVIGIFSQKILSYEINKKVGIALVLFASACLFFLNRINGLVDMDWTLYGKSLLLFYINGLLGSICVIISFKIVSNFVYGEFCTIISKGSLLVIGFNLLMVMLAQNIIERMTYNHNVPFILGIIAGGGYSCCILFPNKMVSKTFPHYFRYKMICRNILTQIMPLSH